MPIKLTNLIARIPPEVEAKVKRVLDKTRPVIQETLRTECRLWMRTSDEAEENKPGAQVRVKVSPGYPAILKDVTFPDDFQRVMLLGRYRLFLEQAREGIPPLLRLREELARQPNSEPWIQANEYELQSIVHWVEELLKVLDQHDPLKTVLAVHDDILGAFEYDARDEFADDYSVNRAVIRIYWGIVGLMTEWLGCTVEDLTIVVLTHELAHAYTQLGADIDGRRWPAHVFAKAETSLKEGLAQYYTARVLQRLERRYGGALKVYKALLRGQPEAYTSHVSWVKDFSPEAVRLAMLEVRRSKEGKLVDFNRRLDEAQKNLKTKEPLV